MDREPTRPRGAGDADGAGDAGDARDALQSFFAASPLPQRLGLRLLLALGRRPRGAAFLTRAPALSQVARSLLAMERYDAPALSRALGFDAEQVVARGRALRRAEGRP